MKKIAIIVPFKNTPIIWFDKLIDSLNKQTNKDFNVLFIDDNDSENKILKEKILKNNYCYFFNDNKEIRGVGNLRDLGIKLTNSEYIWFIDSDDWITEDAVSYLLESFEKYNDIDLIMFDYHWVFNLDKPKNRKKNLNEFVSENRACRKNMYWFHKNYQTDWRVCFKRNFILENNIFHYYDGNVFEDVYYGLIWKTKFKKILLTNKKIYFYNRMNLNSTLNNYKYEPIFLMKILLENKKFLIENNAFKTIWYFYVFNWFPSYFLLKNKNRYGISCGTIKKELFYEKKFYKFKILGPTKLWILNKFKWIK